MQTKAPPPEPWSAVGLTEEEYRVICEHLRRSPRPLELGMYGLMWSEHCSYKSSRLHLEGLPTQAPHVLQGPGENAGVVDIGGDMALAFRIESHNHPSAIEPVQGAATGVGGILRDIFAMGARPVALFNSLHFGDLDDPRVRYLFDGVVDGISRYGNCVGVPTVGGEVHFDPAYHDNPLVNVMCLGLVPRERLVRGEAAGIGNPVFVVGSATGRDGIHGASLLASREFAESGEDMRPAVQVGDPFREKLLIEACLELLEGDAVAGVNDLGAAGLTSAASETAYRAKTGMRIDVDLVPRREEGMTPYEVMLSESQERMLVIGRRGRESEVQDVFDRWDLEAARIGEVTDDGLLRVTESGVEVAAVPVCSLTDGAPTYDRPADSPREPSGTPLEDCPVEGDPERALLDLLGHPNLCSRRSVYEQYDHMVGVNTVVGPGGDAAVLRVKGMRQGIAATVDADGHLCALDPRTGVQNIVAEAFRNLCAVGADPLAVTNCLNFGSPERPQVMHSFVQTVEGMGEACRRLNTPVTGGNVSFYNETAQRSVHPTPVIGMVGVLQDVSRNATPGFAAGGDLVAVLGGGAGSLFGSHYLRMKAVIAAGSPPQPDFDAELATGEACRKGISAGVIRSAHDVSAGGLAVALAECSALSEDRLGARVDLSCGARPDEVLFGEGGPRYVVTVAREHLDRLLETAGDHGCPVTVVGVVGGSTLEITLGGEPVVKVPVDDIVTAREEGLQ